MAESRGIFLGLVIPILIGSILLAACTAPQPDRSVQDIASAASRALSAEISGPTSEEAQSRSPTPALSVAASGTTGLQLTPFPLETSIPPTITTFIQIPGNLASGELAPDFRAEVMGGQTLTRADWAGTFLLLFPSVAGCGECMINLYEFTSVFPRYQDRNVQAAFLSIYPGDQPDIWRPLAEQFEGQHILWGVLDPDFMLNYDIQGLGTVLLIDPGGNLVFRSDFPLTAESFENLLALVPPLQ